MTGTEANRGTVQLRPSPVESRRFGVSVARVEVGCGQSAHPCASPHHHRDADTGRSLTDVLNTASHDVLIVRWPAESVVLGAAAVASRRAIIPAGTVSYWEIAARDLADVAIHTGEGFHAGTVDDASSHARQAVCRVVEDAFAGYVNHYCANPVFRSYPVRDAYVDWADKTLLNDPADVVLLTVADDTVGVATLAQNGTDLEVLLAGITTVHQGQGLYQHLLAGVGREALHRHCDRVVISTQTSNTKVQRAWVRAGFQPFAAVATVHAVLPELMHR